MRRQSCRADHTKYYRSIARMCKTNQCYHNKLPPFPASANVSFISFTATWRVREEGSHEYSAYKLSARRSRVQRLTYTLVDHKWVCFADCCRVVGAPNPGDALNMHRPGGPGFAGVPRDMALGLIGSIICTVLISRGFVCPLRPGIRFDRPHPARRNAA